MRLRIEKMANGRQKLKIVRYYRRSDGKSTATTASVLGFYDELIKEHPDPIAWGKEEAERLTKEEKELKGDIQLSISRAEKLSDASEGAIRKNLGYAAYSSIYHELELDEFWNNRRRYRKFDFNANSVFKMLVYNRLLCPDSKKGAWENRDLFFEESNYSRDQMYSSLSFFAKHSRAYSQKIEERLTELTGRDTLLMYYDVTNYFFEINDPDRDDENGNSTGMRRMGAGKDKKGHPIIQMGLFMDENGLPVTYDLFKGNTHDSKTLIPMIENCGYYNRNGLITVADKGMMGGNNLRELISHKQGYVISNTVRKADKKFQEYVKDDSGYIEMYDPESGELTFKYKSRTTPRYIKVSVYDSETQQEVGTTKVKINERQIVFWSKDYAERQKYERDKVLEKTKKLIGSKSEGANTIKFGARKYIEKKPIVNGEEIKVDDYVLSLDENKVNEEEALDGYYVICTNVVGTEEEETRNYFARNKDKKYSFRSKDGFFTINKSAKDLEIVDIYHGLWRIEETFRVTKTELRARPVFVSTTDHIICHFMICFAALCILRLLQFRLDWKYSAGQIVESLRKVCGTSLEQNLYVFDYCDEVVRDVGNLLGIDFTRKYLTKGEIRSILGLTKKTG